MNTGEIRRAFFRHKVFGELVAVDADTTGHVLAASPVVVTADACKHRLAAMEMTGDAAAIMRELQDWEEFEPVCRDAAHQLHDIFAADREVDRLEADYKARAEAAKAAKGLFDQAQERARQLRRELRDPSVLPLFDQQEAR